jgi:hypothetical protein
VPQAVNGRPALPDVGAPGGPRKEGHKRSGRNPRHLHFTEVGLDAAGTFVQR